MTIQRKTTLALALPLLLAGAISCGKDNPSEGTAAGSAPKGAPSQTGTRVEIARVVSSKGTVRIVRPGEVKGAREADLGSALGGFVEKVLVETGDSVKKNQVLVYVDSSSHSAQARVTRIELDEANRELVRIEGLGKAVASARVDSARTRVARAKAQHSVSALRQSRAAIRAPFAGEIVGLTVERGEVLAPGSPIGRLVQLDKLHVEVSATDRDVAVLVVGGDATITTAAVADPISGKIEHIEQAADRNTRTFKVQVAVENSNRRLLPGMIAQVTFSSERGDNSIYLPQDLLVTQLDGNGLFVVDDKKVARWRSVALGSIIGTDIEIASGLSKGETIVVLGQRDLAEGDPLIVTREGVCCTNGRVVFRDPTKEAAKPGKAADKPANKAEEPVKTSTEPNSKKAAGK